MEIKFLKTHPVARLPERNHGNRELTPADLYHIENHTTADSGYDIFAVEDVIIPSKGRSIAPTGLKVAYISPGYWFRIEARSGLSFKYGILPHPGIVDNQYRGDTGVCLYNHSDVDYNVKKGDKIAQLVVYPIYEATVEWAEEAHETTRGEKGFGSSGK